jgi:DNA-binding XRE family transcriptional regulator/desulfoferrodoxin (superoxide reductase-like protein)
MDCSKVGGLIYRLRREKNMTQKQLAQAICVSDKTISKWERGMGCPDVTLLGVLSAALGVKIETVLSGDLEPNEVNRGNLKRVRFYVCPDCGNILTGTGEADLSCCGRKMFPQTVTPTEAGHRVTVANIEEDYYITFEHEMSKSHFISFVACVTSNRLLLIKLYPEQAPEVHIPRTSGGKLYFYCNKHGLKEIEP